MKRLFLILLATSLTANAWLYWREPAPVSAANSTASPPNAAPTRPMAQTEVVSPLVRLLATIDQADLGKLRDDLRAAGIDEASIRGLFEGALRSRYEAQVAAWQMDSLRAAWWRRVAGSAGRSGPPSRRALVDEPLQELLGRDPLDITEAEARYDFLSPEKRRLLALTDLDYNELRRKFPQARTDASTRAEFEAQQLLARERQNDVLAALTPEERAEYELRFGGTAYRNARRFSAILVTEPEYRAVKPILDELEQQRSGQRSGSTERANAEQRAVDQMVAAVGYERALDFIWGDDSGPYATTVRLLREAGLPAGNAVKLFQLASATGVQAMAIHDNSALDVPAREAALRELQESVRARLDALVSPSYQPKLDDYAIQWFKILGQGRYMVQTPMLVGGGWSVPPEIPVATPRKGPRPTVPLARPVAR